MKSVFAEHALSDICGEIRDVYLSDSRPWILGYSGGKDSTCMVQLVWKALSDLPPDRLTKKVYVISSDTLVESPKIAERVIGSLNKMETSAKAAGLPVSTNVLRPPITETFWVCLLGKGFAAPSGLFRWCTDRLKIRNADRFIRDKVSEYGEAIVLLGGRKDESSSRKQLIIMHKIDGSPLSRHPKFPQTYVYLPLRDFTTEDVWSYLLQNKNPWGDVNRDLLALYKDAGAAECPLVVDTTTPTCGGGRFGCWTCTVAADDASLRHSVENGETWMEPLLELRDELKRTQDPAMRMEVRTPKRQTGKMMLITGPRRNRYEKGMAKAGIDTESDPVFRLVPGPYTMEFCQGYLRRLLEGQMKVRETGPDPNMDLIREDEIHEIQRIWRVERGDWSNTAYRIFEEITGKRLEPPPDDRGGFAAGDGDLLKDACSKAGVPYDLAARLLQAEHSEADRKKSKPKIEKILGEEWRSDIKTIVDDLEERHRCS